MPEYSIFCTMRLTPSAKKLALELAARDLNISAADERAGKANDPGGLHQGSGYSRVGSDAER